MAQNRLTLGSDLQSGRPPVVEGRAIGATLKAFFADIGPEACARIRHAAFDMFEAARRQSASGC